MGNDGVKDDATEDKKERKIWEKLVPVDEHASRCDIVKTMRGAGLKKMKEKKPALAEVSLSQG